MAALSETSFMKEDEMIPKGLLKMPSILPHETHGLGHFQGYDKSSQMAVVAATVPKRQTEGAAGFDLCSFSDNKIPPRSSVIISTGVSVAIPNGFYGRVAGRSSLAFNHDVTAFEGTIDEDYRGELKVKLFNHSDKEFCIKPGERVAQLIIQKYVIPFVSVVKSLPSSERGFGGFGSTGC
jgi:dUTP pyrophosphatase